MTRNPGLMAEGHEEERTVKLCKTVFAGSGWVQEREIVTTQEIISVKELSGITHTVLRAAAPGGNAS